jgi:hypothetical protein
VVAGRAARRRLRLANPEKVQKLVLLALAYNRDATGKPPMQVPAAGAAMNTQARSDLVALWNRQVGCANQYEPAVLDAVWKDMLASDPVGATWGPGVRRAAGDELGFWRVHGLRHAHAGPDDYRRP